MFAATGCNPTETWTKTDGTEGPGVSVGTLAYSPDGGMYLCIRADGAIAVGEACYVKNSSFEIDEVAAAGSQFETGETICFPQVAMADEDYGWALVFGEGEFHVAANCAANVALYSSGTAGRMDDSLLQSASPPGRLPERRAGEQRRQRAGQDHDAVSARHRLGRCPSQGRAAKETTPRPIA